MCCGIERRPKIVFLSNVKSRNVKGFTCYTFSVLDIGKDIRKELSHHHKLKFCDLYSLQQLILWYFKIRLFDLTKFIAWSTGCPTKHDSWWIVLNVFFHNLLSCLIPKKIIINIIWQSSFSKIDPRLRYIGVKDFSNELNCKQSLNLIQYLEDDILNYSSTVMFRRTPCM